MQLLFAGLPNAVLQAICWTLIHSLWQGFIAAVIAALIVTFTKRSTASIRYNLLIGVLLLFVVSISITAARQLQHLSRGNDETIVTGVITNSSSPINFEAGEETVKGVAIQQHLAERFSAYCNEHASLIVLIWFFLFLVKCSRLLAGICYLQHLRRRSNYEVSSYWKSILSTLAQKAGIRSAITFLESELIKVPAVIGFFKPMLLVPVGLLSSLPPEQVEAILLHELAHIRRRDFLMNLLQSVVETFFFFNPAIVWISSLLREEREACCDDIVVASIQQKTNYLQALVSFQELQSNPQKSVLALTGNKQYLFNRVRRILTLENKKLNLMEKTVLILGILGITAFTFITKEFKESRMPATAIKNETIKPVTKEPQGPAIVKKPVVKQKKAAAFSRSKSDTDTLPQTNPDQKRVRSFPSISSNSKSDGKTTESQIEATDNEGKQYSIKKVNGQVTGLTINGTAIPQSQYSDYSEVIGQIDEAQRQRILKRKEDIQLRKADLMVKQKQMQEKRKLLAITNEKELSQEIELRKEKQTINNLKRQQGKELFEQKKIELRKIASDRKAELVKKEKLFNKGRMNNDDISRIISDLDHQNLVPDANNLSFSLTNNELVVNGTKQPAEMHQQFKEKYIQNRGDRFNYSKKGNATSIMINKE